MHAALADLFWAVTDTLRIGTFVAWLNRKLP